MFVLLHMSFSETHNKLFCPELKGEVGTWPNLSVKGGEETLTGKNNTTECFVNWTNRERFIKKVSYLLTDRQKQFFRFRVPVGDSRDTEFLTVVWITKAFQPMLHYPQNFETLSLASMNIVTQNMDRSDIEWNCPLECNICVLPKRQLEDALMNVSKSNGIEWEYLCIQAEYGMSHLFLDDYANDKSLKMLNARNFALPDMLYYWNFLRMLFVTHRYLGFHNQKEDFPNYYCYNHENECTIKELHIRYWVVVYLALVLWLYSPLLIYYFPSQKPIATQSYSQAVTADMFPSYKSPVHFSRCFPKLLCYYTSPNSKYANLVIRVRRLFFLCFLALFSFRLFIYYDYSIFLFMLILVFSVLPKYISIYIHPEVPKCFPLFPSTPYPSDVICWSKAKADKLEYQLLAYIMRERLFLILNSRFWEHIFQCSFHSFCEVSNHNFQFCNLVKLFVYFASGTVLFSFSLLITVVYFLIPMPYFIKEMCCAIFRGEFDFCPGRSAILYVFRSIHCITMLALFLYILATSFVISYLGTDITICTYMGSSLTPKMVMKYVGLATACGAAIYSMVHTLHNQYNSLLTTLVDVLTEDSTFSTLQGRLAAAPNMNLELMKDNELNVYLHKIGEPANSVFKRLVSKDSITSYISKEVYFSVVNWQLPIRRQVVFLILKATLAVAFILLAMMVKNVYHLEKDMGDIFGVASQIAVSFLPTALQFLVYKNKFGHKSEMIQKRDSIESLVAYISNIKP